MANDNTAGDLDRVWKLTKEVGFAMLIAGNRPDLGDSRKVGL
jgi:hypothetical protein